VWIVAALTVAHRTTASFERMRRLVLLVSVIVATDTSFFTALTPLLPHFADEFDLSKAAAGALVATYAVGGLVGAIPGGAAASHWGPKRAVITGLLLMTASSVLFALAGDLWTLALARLLQGFGSVFSWAGGLVWLIGSTPAARRGERLGAAMGAAVFGALLGPVLGAIGGVVGVRVAFLFVSAAGLVLVAWAATMPAAEAEAQPLREGLRALRGREIYAGTWLILLPGFLFGVLVVLVPLQLHRDGWGAAAIGAVFVATTAVEVVLNPVLGRVTDRRGRLQPLRAALVGSALVSVGLAWASQPAFIVLLVLAAGIAYGAFYTPGLALLSEAAERRGAAQALTFGVMNAGWAVGAIIGPAAGGGLAAVAGDAVPYLLMAAVCAATYVATRVRPAAPATT
jgi:MFS family permease